MCFPAPEAVLKGAVFCEYFSERFLWSPVPVTGDLYLFLVWVLNTIVNSHRLLDLIFKEVIPFLFSLFFQRELWP